MSEAPGGAKPFDLEKALAGEKVITRDGREVTGIKSIEIVGTVAGGTATAWDNSGRLHTLYESYLDLFMAPKSLYLNIYTDKEFPRDLVLSRTYETLEDAERHIDSQGIRWKHVKTIEVNI